MAWLKRLFCRHEWRKPRLRLVVLGTGERLGPDYYCCKCGKMRP
jgi:hypothetical protein